MQSTFSLKLLPPEAANEAVIKEYISQKAGVRARDVSGFYILKSSIDSRSRTPYINLTVQAFINEPFIKRTVPQVIFKEVRNAVKRVIIVGAGPAGLFAALRLIELGVQPVILERGKDVRARRRDLAVLNKEGIINSESNYCFGEGGAGTYSDGKLYTRSNKRGDINRILGLFVRFGAEESILYESHPHIGTNKLPGIITAMRECILAYGGELHFNAKCTDFVIEKATIRGLVLANGDRLYGDSVIIATGHSARDIFSLFQARNICIEAKAFALGVRVEHPQTIIDRIQYHSEARGNYLPPASYSLVQQVDNKGVFSFCMCPGGIIAPASTNAGELVVNGWSPSKRNNPFANSGMVVSCELPDISEVKGFINYLKQNNSTIESPLAVMYFQQMVEEAAYTAGGGNFVAPAQRLVDFCENRVSADLPVCSYLPGIVSNNLTAVLPEFIALRLQQAFADFGKKMKGYYTNEAVLVATESRTSSPVRIPRDSKSFQHPEIKNLYPCGEGAGYAGGIVSAAMDGENVASSIGASFGI